ncbi:MAG: dTMP kinase [Pseudonocardiaceae bacterium]
MVVGGGLLVTLDGPSGVGKTTVSGLVGDRLAAAGVPVVLTATPSSSSLGELARHGTHQFFGVALTCLVAADRYHHDQTTVREALQRGAVVVCDRYVPSSLVLDRVDGASAIMYGASIGALGCLMLRLSWSVILCCARLGHAPVVDIVVFMSTMTSQTVASWRCTRKRLRSCDALATWCTSTILIRLQLVK